MRAWQRKFFFGWCSFSLSYDDANQKKKKNLMKGINEMKSIFATFFLLILQGPASGFQTLISFS